jgi:hypothetical protein
MHVGGTRRKTGVEKRKCKIEAPDVKKHAGKGGLFGVRD